MILHQLKISAFGPYMAEETINFDRFSNAGIFLITGATGSGKTTIFDAISFVLYGEVSGQRKETKTLKSDFAKTNSVCFVMLTFSVNGKCYKIIRWPEQLVLKANKTGLKKQKHKAELTLPDGSIKTNLKEIYDILVNDVLGVDRDNFNKMVMLPQGKFQKLLTEKGEEQVNTFRKLFGTGIFETVSTKLFEERQNIKKEYDNIINDNEKKVKNCLLNIKEINLEENLSFKAKVCLIKEQIEEDEKELEKIEEKTKEIDLKIKDVELALNLQQRFKEKEKHLIALKEKKTSLEQKKPDLEELKKKKNLLNNLKDLKFLYSIWQDYEKNLEEKSLQLKKLNRLLNEQKAKQQETFIEFKKLSFFEKQKEDILKKNSEILIFVKSFNMAKEVENNIKIVEKKIANLEEKIKEEETRLKLNRIYVEIKDKQKFHNNCDLLIKLNYKNDDLLQQLENLNKKYLNSCKDFYEHQAAILAKNLKKGMLCPVCGSLNHPHPKNLKKTERFITEAVLENLRKEIFKKKDDSNVLTIKIKALVQELEKEEIFLGDFFNLEMLRNFLKQDILELENLIKKFNSLKKEVKDISFLKGTIKYEEEIFKLNVEKEKWQINIKELEKQKNEFLKNIPKELQTKESLKQNKNMLDSKQKELEEKIALIKKNKELEEKKLNDLVLKEKSLTLTFEEIGIRKEKAKTNFYDRLKKINYEFEVFLKEVEKFYDLEKFVEEKENVFKELDSVNFKLKTIEKDLKTLQQKNSYDDLLKEQKEVNLLKNSLKEKEKFLLKRVVINKNCFKEIEINLKKTQELEEKFKTYNMLSEVAKGSRKRVSFEKYVLTSYLNEVLVFANNWLKKATSNRYIFYGLNFDDCLNFNIFDAYSGRVRHVSTLSGGETFAASLALCLGLCSRVSSISGAVELDIMLIDEGFGSLDSKYLDDVVSCLLMLNKEGRQIGLISHIYELKNKIKSQILVEKNAKGGSKIVVKS